MQLPTYDDVARARIFIADYLRPTPLIESRSLSELLDCHYYVKCENFQPVGAFKVRGGVNLVGNLDGEAKRVGVISASTGNHGQSIAFAGQRFKVPVVIYAPAKNANPLKVRAMRHLGAEVRLVGRDFDEARTEVERVAGSEGYRYIHSANEPMLIAGVGTMALEILEDLPDADVFVVPVGAGSGVCGIALALRERHPSARVIGVQSAQAPAVWQAWKQRRLDIEAQMNTCHEGLGTRVPFAMPLSLMWELLDDFVLVEDEDIEEAIRLLAGHARILAEGAGAASLAASLKIRQEIAGKKVVGIVSGGNMPLERFATILAG